MKVNLVQGAILFISYYPLAFDLVMKSMTWIVTFSVLIQIKPSTRSEGMSAWKFTRVSGRAVMVAKDGLEMWP